MIQLVCCFSAWLLIITSIWRVWNTINNGYTHLKKLHSIPCANCQFFTGDYRLKCTVNPMSALTESALECKDYRPEVSVFSTDNY
jgi:hypothetical protein